MFGVMPAKYLKEVDEAEDDFATIAIIKKYKNIEEASKG